MEYPATFVKYFRGFERLRLVVSSGPANRAQQEIQTNGRQVHVYWGGTRTGKTRRAYDQFSGRGIYRVFPSAGSGGVPWFDNYAGEDVCLFDDFRGEASLSFILQLTDRYPFSVSPRGGPFLPFVSTLVVFTSNNPYTSWWPSSSLDDMKAFAARVTEERHFERLAGNQVKSQIVQSLKP